MYQKTLLNRHRVKRHWLADIPSKQRFLLSTSTGLLPSPARSLSTANLTYPTSFVFPTLPQFLSATSVSSPVGASAAFRSPQLMGHSSIFLVLPTPRSQFRMPQKCLTVSPQWELLSEVLCTSPWGAEGELASAKTGHCLLSSIFSLSYFLLIHFYCSRWDYTLFTLT